MSDEEEHNLNNGAGGSQSQTVRIKMPRMVQSHLAPPAEFSFRSEDWQKWVKRWKRYAVGSGLAYQDDESKLNTLLYCMGPKADDILLSLPLENGDDEDYDRVLEEFNNHFGVCVNVVLERQKFLRRKQLPNESVDNFITDLHRLAENCKYQTMKEEFIRDNILVGMRDRTLADAMTLDKTLTLKKASDKARAKEELQREQELAARSQADKSEVSFVKAGGGGRNNNNRRSNNNTPRGSSDKKTPTSEPACSKCGRTPQHRFADCPAKQSDCKKCNKKGHWAAMCPLEVKALNQEATGGNSDDDLFVGSIALLNQEDSFADEPPKACVSTPPSEQHDSLLSPPVRRQVNGRDTGRGPRLGPWLDDLRALDEVGDLVSGSVARVHAVGAITKSRPPWTATVTAGGRQLQFQVDTGADVTVISNKTFLEEFSGTTLQKTSHRLRGPGQRPLTVLGLISVDVKWRDRTSTTDVYVIQEDARSLLGRPAIEDLKMLKWDLDAELVSATKCIANVRWEDKFPTIFEGLGCINYTKPYTVVLKPDAKGHAVTAPRRVSVQLREKVRAELQRMVKMGVITPVDEPTEWCAPMVVVPKPNGSVRICVDYTELNRHVHRERYMLPAVDELLALLGNAKWFTKLDANHGYHQLLLSEESQRLTTFITPFGRFCYNRLPMGLSSAGEHFQKRVGEVLAGLEGVIHLADDILIVGRTREEHDARLEATLSRLRDHRVTLNSKKCDFATQRTKFLGYIIDAESGIQPDPEKVAAIVQMPQPKSPEDVYRFLGMVNYQLKFLDHLSSLTQPLRDLCRDDVEFQWTAVHDAALKAIKEKLVSAPALAFFDPAKRVRVSADSSSYGLGAVLENFWPTWEHNGVVHTDVWRPVYYASRTLTDTERRYAQIEKEALALTWACEKFAMFVTGAQDLLLRTDHKPLVSLLGCKPLSELTPRLQRLRMRLMRFSYEIEHVAGKSLMSPDTLSRAPLPTQTPDRDVLTDNEVEFYARAVIADLPVSDVVMAAVREAQTNDPMAQTVLQCVREGWPQPRDVPAILAPFFKHRGSLCVVDGLLVYESRVYVPRALQEDMLARLHKGHLGETKCLGRARASVWWPGISTRVRQTCADCEICAKHRPQPVEPLMPSTVPERPWQRLAADLCQRGAHHYLVVVDYYSRYPEVARLSSLTAAAVINKMRDILARHGVPEELRTDNGPQFDCTEFRDFADEMGFRLVTMSPHHSQSNGQAEAAVKAVKNIIKKEDDPFQGLLAYRTAPTESGYSPAELLMGRRLRTTVPTLGTNLQPRVVDVQHHRSVLEEGKKTAKAHFDRRHRARELRPLVSGERVWVRDTKANGVVVRRRPEPRSYDVQVEGHGVLRRNRAFLTPLQCATDEADESDSDDAERPPEVERVVDNDADEALQAPPPRRSARTVRKPERLIEVCLVRNAKDY